MGFGLSRRIAVALVAVMTATVGTVARAGQTAPPYGFVGAEVQPVTLDQARALGLPSSAGVLVRDLVSWGPAYAAGMRRGDVVTRYDGVSISGLSHLVALVQGRKPGETVPAVVHRLGRDLPVDIRLARFPAGWSASQEALAVLPTLGLRLRALTPRVRDAAGVRWGTRGLLAEEVTAGSPAARAGLVAGDVVVAAEGTLLSDVGEAERVLSAAAWLLVEGAHGMRAVRLDGSPLPPARQAAGASWQALPGGGWLVLDVRHDTPAAAAGVRSGDRIKAATDAPPQGDLVVEGLDGLPRAVTLPTEPEPEALPAASAAVPFLGATVAALSPGVAEAEGVRPTARGVVVTAVEPGGRAASVGLRPGLVVVSVDQRPVASPAALDAALAAAQQRGMALAVLLVEGRQGFRVVDLPMQAPEATAAAVPTVAPALLQWQQPPR